MTAPTDRRLLGITVLPEFFQHETIERVLQNVVETAGATAITTSPYCLEVADEKTGSREPPDDAGAGQVRLLDRPLWGRRELFVRTAPSFEPDLNLYRGLKYQPAQPTALTRQHAQLLPEVIRQAQARHVAVYLQVQAAIPPGYRVQFGGPDEADRPRLPDGRIPPRRLAKNGSLASPHIRRYTAALLVDLSRAYPGINGIRVDWPEYPPYFLDDLFLDFSASAREAAIRLKFDFDRMQRDTLALYRHLHGGLTDADLEAWLAPDEGRHPLVRYLTRYSGVLDLLRFKAALVDELLAEFRQALDQADARQVELVANAFPPPFSLGSGLDFAQVGRHCASACVKLYSMHWAMMLRFYGDALVAANPQVSEKLLVQSLVRWFDLADDQGLPRLKDYFYPEPDQPHPAGLKAMQRKIRQAQAEAGTMPILALAHGYGPLDDFRRRLQAAWEAGPHGVWINRYAYLSDDKLAAVGQVCQAPA